LPEKTKVKILNTYKEMETINPTTPETDLEELPKMARNRQGIHESTLSIKRRLL
jgi:hypothetical protein